jgi:hypothetical protein
MHTSRLAHAEELERIADAIEHASIPDLQSVLRRAALRLRNADDQILEPAWEDALSTVVAEREIDRRTLIREILRTWLTENSYVPLRLIEGGREDEA